jgi:hypothetical protein
VFAACKEAEMSLLMWLAKIVEDELAFTDAIPHLFTPSGTLGVHAKLCLLSFCYNERVVEVYKALIMCLEV